MGFITQKIEIKQIQDEAIFFNKSCGASRFAYNQGLALWHYIYEEHLKDPVKNPKPTWNMISKILNAEKDQFYPWMREVSCYGPNAAIANLGSAWANYFRDLKKKSGRKAERPKFNKKGHHDSFAVHNNDLKIIDSKTIQLPKIGKVSLKEAVKVKGKIMKADISRQADRWFISICFEIEHKAKVDVVDPKMNKLRTDLKLGGIDLGITAAAALSTGQKFTGLRPLKLELNRIKRLQRKLSKQKRGGRNYKKTLLKIQRAHGRVQNARKDFLHKTTTNIVRKFDILFLETLGIENMLKNHKLALALSDASLRELIRQITYKAEMQGKTVLFIDQFFPSTKQCRICKTKNGTMTLADRIFKCGTCHHEEDRDIHAAKNILNEGVRILQDKIKGQSTLGRRGIKASGGVTTTKSRKRFGKSAPMKQEPCINILSLKVLS